MKVHLVEATSGVAASGETMADLIPRVRAVIEKALGEVEAERTRLMRALGALGGPDREPGDASQTRARPSKAGREPAKAKRAARGQRQAEFLALVKARPGAPMAEMAREMGVRPQQLYPIARRLSAEGAITKSERGYVVADRPERNGASAKSGAGPRATTSPAPKPKSRAR